MSNIVLQSKSKVSLHIQESCLTKLQYVLRKILEKFYLQTRAEKLKSIFLRFNDKTLQRSLIEQCIQILFENLRGNQEFQQKKTINQKQEQQHEYLDLQSLLQSQEELNRKHIKLEQQMQIYVDSLVDKIHQLQKKINSQLSKNQLLIQKNKRIQQELSRQRMNRNNTKNNVAKQYLKTRFNQKNQPYFKEKSYIEKIEERNQKMSDKRLQNKIFFKQQKPKPQAQQLITNHQRSRGWLHDRNVVRKHVSEKTSKRSQSQSLYLMKEQKNKAIRILKNKTEDMLNIRKIPKRNSSSDLY